MYDFVDRPVTSLDHGCRFLIWSMRSWTLISRHGECPGPALAPAFAQWRMIGGLKPFLHLMMVLNRDAMEKIRFCSLDCNHVSEHEAILLDLVVKLAAGDRTGPRDTLRLLVCEDSVGDALGAIDELAASMNSASIRPLRPDTAMS